MPANTDSALRTALRTAKTSREDLMLRDAVRGCGFSAYCYDGQGVIMVKGPAGDVKLARKGHRWYLNGQRVRGPISLTRALAA